MIISDKHRKYRTHKDHTGKTLYKPLSQGRSMVAGLRGSWVELRKTFNELKAHDVTVSEEDKQTELLILTDRVEYRNQTQEKLADYLRDGLFYRDHTKTGDLSDFKWFRWRPYGVRTQPFCDVDDFPLDNSPRFVQWATPAYEADEWDIPYIARMSFASLKYRNEIGDGYSDNYQYGWFVGDSEGGVLTVEAYKGDIVAIGQKPSEQDPRESKLKQPDPVKAQNYKFYEVTSSNGDLREVTRQEALEIYFAEAVA
jgi:hypothetical protein